MPNRFPGTCYKCGNHVPAGAGVFEKVNKSARKKWPGLSFSVRWQVQHHECAHEYARAAHHIHNPQPPLVTDAKYPPALDHTSGSAEIADHTRRMVAADQAKGTTG